MSRAKQAITRASAVLLTAVGEGRVLRFVRHDNLVDIIRLTRSNQRHLENSRIPEFVAAGLVQEPPPDTSPAGGGRWAGIYTLTDAGAAAQREAAQRSTQDTRKERADR